MLESAGPGDAVDRWAFHAKTLATFPAQYTPACFEEALAFAVESGRGPRRADALRMLQGGRAHLEEAIAGFERSGARGWAEAARRNLGLAALATPRQAVQPCPKGSSR